MPALEPIGEGLWLQRHPLTLMGCQLGRNVAVIRLSSGKLIIHSTARFSPDDVKAIRELGEPGWLVEATHFHGTCTAAGVSAFPGVPCLAPPGFPAPEGVLTQPILPAPPEWEDEVVVIALEGVSVCEHAFFHRGSGTLIVADMFFNLPPDAGKWTLGVLRWISGLKQYPGMSRLLHFCIKDRGAFSEAIRKIDNLDFEKIVVAHGDPITSDAKAKFREVLDRHGFPL